MTTQLSDIKQSFTTKKKRNHNKTPIKLNSSIEACVKPIGYITT